MSKGIVSAIFTSILIGTLLFSKQVSTECVSQTTQISAHSMTAYENVTTHEGDLVIDGTETFVIENCIYTQGGNILVKERAKLLIKNARLQMNQSYPSQYDIKFVDDSEVHIQNSSVLSDWCGIEVAGNSDVRLNASSIPDDYLSVHGRSSLISTWSSFSEIDCCPNSNTTILNSRIDVRIALRFNKDSVASIDGLKGGSIDNWRLLTNETVENESYEITINQTTVESWALHLDFRTTVSASNSTFSEILLDFTDTNDKIDNLRPGFFDSWSRGKIRLTNTSVEAWPISLADSTMNISNSHIGILMDGASLLQVHNSTVCWCGFARCIGRVFHEDTIYTCTLAFIESDVYISGDMGFEQAIRTWALTNVTRNYNVIVNDNFGTPVSGVSLSVKTKDNVEIWNGMTDVLGKADFNLTFSDNNYTDVLKLEAIKGNFSTTMNVGLLADTPVFLALRYFADLNADGTVNILDITVVAAAYNTKPGDPKWNSAADLDKNGTVNIVDVTMVAKDYGKTV